jgi:hypothetical protein
MVFPGMAFAGYFLCYAAASYGGSSFSGSRVIPESPRFSNAAMAGGLSYWTCEITRLVISQLKAGFESLKKHRFLAKSILFCYF